MKIKQILITLISPFILFSCAGPSVKSNDPIISVPEKDPELEKAQKDALANLDYFIKSFNAHLMDTLFHYSLKVDFVKNEEHEHMWITLKKIINDKFQGILDSDPEIIKNIKSGDLIIITKDQIEDWMIIDTKTKSWEGGFSVKVLEKRKK
jgi:uncharacterized protein YegJ (DUF2314 family)